MQMSLFNGTRNTREWKLQNNCFKTPDRNLGSFPVKHDQRGDPAKIDERNDLDTSGRDWYVRNRLEKVGRSIHPCRNVISHCNTQFQLGGNFYIK